MNKLCFIKKHTFKTSLILFIAVVATIYGCRKDNSATAKLSDAAPKVAQAKTWYEKNYPIAMLNNSSVKTQSTSHDLNQWIKPDWDNPQVYEKNNENVIEMPVDPESKFAGSIKLNQKSIDPKYSRSYYLLINNGETYNAYIITIIADSAYVGTDMSKITRNTYRKRDADFTGSVLYFTPHGAYLGGYGYQNGQILPAVESTVATQQGTPRVQSTGNNDIGINVAKQECTDWYIVYYIDGVYWYDEYLTTTCKTVDDGQSGGSGGPPTPPPPCPAGTHPGPPVTPPCIPKAVESVKTNDVTIFYVPPPPPADGGGMPPPPSQTCSKDPARVPCPPDEDPCAKAKTMALDAAFKAELNNLKTKLNLNYESGYLKLAGQASQYRTGTPNTLAWDAPQISDLNNYSIEYLNHTHYAAPNSLSIISDADINAFVTYIHHNKVANANTFTFTVTTSQGTTYSLILNDRQKMESFYNMYSADAAGRSAFSGIFGGYVNPNNSVAQNETAFISTLKALDSGISILKANSDLSNWQLSSFDSNTGTATFKNCN